MLVIEILVKFVANLWVVGQDLLAQHEKSGIRSEYQIRYVLKRMEWRLGGRIGRKTK